MFRAGQILAREAVAEGGAVNATLETIAVEFETIAALAIALFGFRHLIPQTTNHLGRQPYHRQGIGLPLSLQTQQGCVHTRYRSRTVMTTMIVMIRRRR